MKMWFSRIIIFIVTFILYRITQTSANPSFPSWHVYASIKAHSHTCDPDFDELCQYCAKFTQSEIAYPMCCVNEDDVRTWCKLAMEFGYQ